MPWIQRLAEPILLDNVELLYTLRDAREFVLALPDQDLRNAKWQALAGSVLSAAHTSRADISIATEQLRQALLTPPFAPVRLANDTLPKIPPAPSVKRHRGAKLRKLK